MISTVAGIPCTIQDIQIIGTYSPARVNCEADYSCEAEYPEVEFTVCDRRGRPAPWLTAKMTEADITRIETQILGQE